MNPLRLLSLSTLAIVYASCLVGARKKTRFEDRVPRGVMEFPLGVTQSGQPILAWITSHDLDIMSPKQRILLVASSDHFSVVALSSS